MMSSHPQVASSYPWRPERIEFIIASTFNVPIPLTDRKSLDLRVSYAKYLAVEDIMKRLSQMITAGTWTRNKPTNNDIIEVFVSRSVYYKVHNIIFPRLHLFPAMQRWLENGDDAPKNAEVWGDIHKFTFANLKIILDAHDPLFKHKDVGKKGGKGKEVQKGSQNRKDDRSHKKERNSRQS
jgi:hypothetical protein